MDLWSTVCAVIVIIVATIIIQYLLNPFWHRLGLPKDVGKEDEKSSMTEDEKKKEEEFYRQIWNAKKRR